jgi:rubredoxin
MAAEPTVVYSAANTQQAYLLKGLLEEQGIAARVVNDAVQMAGGELPLGWPSAARVVVAEADAERARAFAAEFDRRTVQERRTEQQASDDDADDDLPPGPNWSDWPLCPDCGARRTAHCPDCGASRTDFRLAEQQPSGEGEEVLLTCDDCDDVIQPQWYRRCAACGHDFSSGLEPSSGGDDAELAQKKIWYLLAALAAATAALLAYFIWLFQFQH